MISSPENVDTLPPLDAIDTVVHAPARLMVMALLYVIDSADFIFVMGRTGLTWGNLSTHLKKLENAEYVAIEKGFRGKKPHTMIRLTSKGRKAFVNYREEMQKLLARFGS